MFILNHNRKLPHFVITTKLPSWREILNKGYYMNETLTAYSSTAQTFNVVTEIGLK